jgi:SPP1 family predicted phage head-tail adaptor
LNRLDRRITIQKLDPTVEDSTTGKKDTWILHKKIWAGKDSRKSVERLHAAKMISFGDTVYLTRYDDSITTQMRVEYKGDTMEIKGIEEIGRFKMMRIITQRTDARP